MKHWTLIVVAISLASFPGVASAQADCNAVPAGPARTDCCIGLSRVYRGQSDVAAGNTRVQLKIQFFRCLNIWSSDIIDACPFGQDRQTAAEP